MKNRTSILNDKIFDQLAQNDTKLEIQPTVEFAQKLENKILIEYEKEKIRTSPKKGRLISIINIFNSISIVKKFAMGGMIALVLVMSFSVISPRIFSNAVRALTDRLLEVMTIHLGDEASFTFSTSTEDMLNPSVGPKNLSSTEFSLEQAINEGRVKLIFKEIIDGVPVTAIQLAGGTYHITIGKVGKTRSSLVVEPEAVEAAQSDPASYLKKNAQEAIADARSQQKIDEHLENTYHISEFRNFSIDEFLKITKSTVLNEIDLGRQKYDPDEELLLVRFPDGSTATVHQRVEIMPAGQKYRDLMIEAVDLTKVSFPLRPYTK